ncbi:iron-hydroxamate ABC transporter substrate-binding protein [Paenibacillus sp. NPDC058174]|uniref:iron-hydroxamate ABC transporter substrate-binding protein n=1 Tax=Paenibacillus sp. NPDC058174 TaxID=3346366 RepID=UPI0036DCC4A7
MKKTAVAVILLLTLVISACGENSEPQQEEAAGKSGTREYMSENGPIEIPADPKRIVALTNAPNILAMDVDIVGVDEWTKANPLFADRLEGVQTVSDEKLEEVLALKPDLIIAGSTMKNLDKLSEIAPTIVYTWGKLDYLNQQLEIGKVLNKEKEAQAWIDDFTSRAKAAGEEIQAKAGANTTVSVFETDSQNFYVLGNNWARGTEILYQAMGLQMTDIVKQNALAPGYYTISLELLPEYAGDFIVLSRKQSAENSFMQSEVWKKIDAVKNNRVIEIDTEASSYSDPITLEHLLKIFHEQFLAD